MKEVDTNELIRKAEELLHQLRTKDTAESVGSTSTAPRAQQPATMANSMEDVFDIERYLAEADEEERRKEEITEQLLRQTQEQMMKHSIVPALSRTISTDATNTAHTATNTNTNRNNSRMDESVGMLNVSHDNIPAPIVVDDHDDEEVIFVNETRGGPIEVVDLCGDMLENVAQPANSERKRRHSIEVEAAAPSEAATSKEAQALAPSPNKIVRVQCPVCLDSITKTQPQSTTCGHVFCLECIRQSIRMHKKCPMCNTKLTLKQVHPLFLSL